MCQVLWRKIVSIYAVRTVTTKHVTDLMDDAFIVVQTAFMESYVIKEKLSCFFFQFVIYDVNEITFDITSIDICEKNLFCAFFFY